MSEHGVVPFEPDTNESHVGVADYAAPPLVSSSSSSRCRSGTGLGQQFSHVNAQIFSNVQSYPSHNVHVQVAHVQSQRNRNRILRHQRHQQQKAQKERQQRRRMLWNQHQREQRIATEQVEDSKLVPTIQTEAVAGQIRIGSINMEKSNPEKLEQLTLLAAKHGWEVTVVSECGSTSRAARRQPFAGFKYWKWENWEFVHTGHVGILLNPTWSEAWHKFKARKHRSDSGRTITLDLPRDPHSLDYRGAANWLITGVWAPVSTVPQEELDSFWDEIAGATSSDGWQMSDHVPHIVAGDFNSQVFEPQDDDNPSLSSNPIVGQYKPPNRHQLDSFVYERILALGGDWVHADSFKPAIGNRHRCTWFSSIHRKYYELDWMLLGRRHLRRLIGFTMRHVTMPLHTQHSAKEYTFRLEQSGVRSRPPPIVRPNLNALRGNSEAAKEARTTLASQVRARLVTNQQMAQTDVDFSQFRTIVQTETLQVCGPSRRSCRKPWLRTDQASSQMTPLVAQCLSLRNRKRQLQQAIDESNDPDGHLTTELEECRAQHTAVKKRQRQLVRSLEKTYWDGILASHPHTEADSFQFFHTLRQIQTGGNNKAARVNPFTPEEWKDHFATISSSEEFLTPGITDFIDGLPVSPELRNLSQELDSPLTDAEIDKAITGLRPGAGGGDNVPPVVLKTLHQDPHVAIDIRRFVRELWSSPAEQWERLGLDGPGLAVPLWKQKEPFNAMSNWRGVCLLWVIPRVLARIINSRGQTWFEQSSLPIPESFGFRRGLGCDDALFQIRRMDEEISAWQSFGWTTTTYEAALIDLQKAYPTANKRPFWYILQHHGINPQGPFSNALRGFHSHRQYCIKTGPNSSSAASVSSPYKPERGFGEGDGTSPWSWNVLYSVIIRYAQKARRDNAQQRNLECGVPWRFHSTLDLDSNWTRKNDGRPSDTCMVTNTVFADDTTLYGLRTELHEADDRGPSGLDVFSNAVQAWGSTEHPGKRERYVFGSNAGTCLVGGGIGPSSSVGKNES